MKQILLILFCIFLFSGCTEKEKKDSRPNVLVIMVDDMGYSDIGCFGGEIEILTK